jgi:hypothetical protein
MSLIPNIIIWNSIFVKLLIHNMWKIENVVVFSLNNAPVFVAACIKEKCPPAFTGGHFSL